MTEHDDDIGVRAQARIGTWLKDKYRLDRVIGTGGMAVVYAATHRNQAEFAVKVLHRELSLNEMVRTRFRREGYAANSVKHRGAVRVHDDDTADDGAAFLVMELLQGVRVEELWMRNGHRLDPQAVLGIGYQLLDVLAAAHANAVIHRDIKPANIFLTNEGIVKVLDFGIARLRDVAMNVGGASASASSGTQTGVMMGTPAFMSPEQAMAKASDIDAQSDVWAVGATLFTLISGHLVHEGDNAQQLLIKAATTPPRSLLAVAPDVPQPVARVIDVALAFDKAQRWPDAVTMRDALREACLATYGEGPSRTLLLSLLGDDAASPDSTQRLHPLSASMLVRGVPSVASPAVTGALSSRSGTPSAMIASSPSRSARPSAAYRPSTELTSSSAMEGTAPPRSGPRLAVMVSIAVCAFVLAFGGGIAAMQRFGRSKPSPSVGTGLVDPPQQPVELPTASAAQPQVEQPVPSAAPSASVAEPVAPASPSSAVPRLAEAANAGARPHAKHDPVASPTATSSGKPDPVGAGATPKPGTPDCTTPYTLDADGNKQWKMECLGH